MGAGGTAVANTVLGPVAVDDLGVVAVHEALLSVLPGAQYAYDITIDRADTFAVLAGKLAEFRSAGGGTLVDSTGMFHGRDLMLLEALSRSSGVHIIASTGLGPEDMLGGYFLTPQTNPPTPWPAEKFTELFVQEVTDGMVIPRLERRRPAGIVVAAASVSGMTPTEESLFRAAARSARQTGIPASIRYGADPLHDLGILLEEGLAADRIVVAGLDRADALASGAPLAVARAGAFVAIDHVGSSESGVDDAARVDVVLGLAGEGFVDRILLSSSAIGVAKGLPASDGSYSRVLTSFIPQVRAKGLSDADAERILVGNPRELLGLRTPVAIGNGGA